MLAPVALFVYNRIEHTRATLKALADNTLGAKTDLIVFSDGAKNTVDLAAVDSVRRLVREISGFASVRVVERPKNMGLARSVIAGVTEILEKYDNVIVLEDDLITSRHFLAYMNDALTYYRDDLHVFSVTGYTFPAKFLHIPNDYPYETYVGYRCCSWSWGTWRERWRRVDWGMRYYTSFCQDHVEQQRFNRGGQDMTTLLRLQHEGKIDSWAIRFCYAHHANDMRCIYPTRTLVRNIGLDNSGTHSKPDRRFTHLSLDETWQPSKFSPGNELDRRIAADFLAVWAPPQPSAFRLIFRRTKHLTRSIWHRVLGVGPKVMRLILRPAQDVSVLVVNTYQQNGGAARAANRVFCGVRQHYPSARYLTLFKEDRDPDVIGLAHNSARGLLAQRLIRLDQSPLRRYPGRPQTFFSPAHRANPLRIPLSRYRANLVHLHWVGHSMLRVEELARLRCPVVWTLHDTWAFTGGCHYTGECEGFKKQCGHCPQLASHVENDLSRDLINRKNRAYQKLNMTIVAPSRWLAEMARQSSLFHGRRIEVIPNGLDTDTFKPIDHHVARQYLNLSPDEPVLLFGAHWLPDPRKGGDLLCAALSRLDLPCTLLTFGEGQLPLENSPRVTVRPLGSLTDDMSLAMAYSAADAFVCPSREDNLPNTVAEALACGTPCIAFDINGLPDMIEHHKNGWLARPFESADLAEGIRWLVRHPQQEQLRRAAREKAVSEYSMARMKERYVALYTELLK